MCWVWLLLLMLSPHPGWALSLNAPPPTCQLAGGDGELTLYNDAEREVERVRYRRADGAWDAAALATVNRLLRSPDGAATTIDRRLILLLDQLQDHFGADVVEIISGYRSPAYNRHLKASGRAVASDSRHMHGDAADVHLDEITESAVREYAQSLRCGGVGFYPALHFVHVDLGPVRRWSEPPGARKLVGETPIVLTTDRNYYFAGDQIQFTASGVLQYFVRGAWKSLHVTTPATLRFHPERLPHGKYRLRVDGATPAYSNEFYFKQE